MQSLRWCWYLLCGALVISGIDLMMMTISVVMDREEDGLYPVRLPALCQPPGGHHTLPTGGETQARRLEGEQTLHCQVLHRWVKIVSLLFWLWQELKMSQCLSLRTSLSKAINLHLSALLSLSIQSVLVIMLSRGVYSSRAFLSGASLLFQF